MTLDDIETANRPALLHAWADLLGAPAPKGLSQAMLRRLIAFELQSKAHGGLSPNDQKHLNRPASAKPAPPRLKPGGRLVREWNGTTHIVDVTDTGFLWQGKSWRSLSAIAREITGAHWSGPRFFGLTKEQS